MDMWELNVGKLYCNYALPHTPILIYRELLELQNQFSNIGFGLKQGNAKRFEKSAILDGFLLIFQKQWL